MQFISYSKPSLQLGTYTINVTQTVEVKDKNKEFKSTQKIAVLGDRFSLNPHNIYMLYPAPDSIHNIANVLPHIITNDEFYPWERSVSKTNNTAPYLALLLFYENEDFTSKTITIEDFKNQNNFTLEVSDITTDKINVIEVKKSLLENIIPSAEELTLLTHVQKTDKNRSVILSNRLPFKGGRTTACLVSLENRFNTENSFDFKSLKNKDLITLVLLKKWSFTDVEFYSTQNIKNINNQKILDQLHEDKRTYKGKENFLTQIQLSTKVSQEFLNTNKKEILKKAMDTSPVFMRLLNELNYQTISLPSKEDSISHIFFKKLMVPISHYLRTGDQTVSWYRGPLISGEQKNKYSDITFPINSADNLLFLDKNSAMFDITYASAWELGKLLCLKNKEIASEIFTIKKNSILHNIEKQNKTNNHLLPIQIKSSKIDFSSSLITWIQSLKEIRDIPLNYLLPHEKLLPKESLRFFRIDSFWIECLIEGALQVGGKVPKEFDELKTIIPYSGILLRSEIQLIWPNLEIVAKNTKIISINNLTKDTTLYLFDKIITNVKIQQAKQALHFEVNNHPSIFKNETTGIIDIKNLTQANNSAECAKKLLANRKGINFLVGTNNLDKEKNHK